MLPAADHPDEPSRCLVTGTGLTHFGEREEPRRDARALISLRIEL